MKDLSSRSGFPLQVDEKTGRLEFGYPMAPVEPAVRSLADLAPVLMDPAARGPMAVYFMYRDMGLPADRERLHAAGLRYDITVIPPGFLGVEFVKTAGHYHPPVPGSDVTYPEVYEVIHGRAHYLLQKPAAGNDLADVLVVEADPGDKVLIPPGYGHITINMGTSVLVMSNVVAKDFASLYEPYLQRRGGAYYGVLDAGEESFVFNEAYGDASDLHMVPPEDRPELGLSVTTPLYRAATANPDQFRYLVRPQDFVSQLTLPELDEVDDLEDEDD